MCAQTAAAPRNENLEFKTEANAADCECLADFSHSNEPYFIETLTGITQEMKTIHFACKISRDPFTRLVGRAALQLDDIIEKVSFLASEETSVNFAWPLEQHLQQAELSPLK